jgi:hypothetical protein
MGYRIREKLAYSHIGYYVATRIRNRYFQTCRTHWVQQAFAEWSMRVLP